MRSEVFFFVLDRSFGIAERSLGPSEEKNLRHSGYLLPCLLLLTPDFTVPLGANVKPKKKKK